jgi:hypothetical protein
VSFLEVFLFFFLVLIVFGAFNRFGRDWWFW